MLRQTDDSKVGFGDLLIVRSEFGLPGLAMGLDQLGFSDGCWTRALYLSGIPQENPFSQTLKSAHTESTVLLAKEKGQAEPTDKTWVERSRLIGVVASGSDISFLNIELVRVDLDLSEGRLVEVQIGDKDVLFQVTNGLTREEILQQKNERGYVRAQAKKIGSWNQEKGRFETVKWLPKPNAPVFLVAEQTHIPRLDAVGFFPGTNYPVTVNILVISTGVKDAIEA